MTAKVMYVDDEHYLLNAFRRMVGLAGFEVVTCSSPQEALERLKVEPVEVICSDFRMPITNGLEFLAAAHEIVPDALRILITAHHEFEVAVDAFKVGVYRLIPKPWKREVLVGSLIEGVNTVRLRRENERLQGVVREQVRELEELNATLDAKVAQRTDQVIGSLITCLDYRDEETMSHSKRVSLLSRAIAARMGVTGRTLIDIEWGAMLHDIGKIGVPDAILLKPGKLTEQEWEIMRRHADIGYHMIAHIDFLSTAAKVVGDHHERFDGSGYPGRKRGEAIYLGARIFAVADTFDAITSDRPYRKARSAEEARAEILRVTGTQLDPACVDAFMALTDEVWAEIRTAAAEWAAGHSAPDEASSLSRGHGLEVVHAAIGYCARPSPA